MLYVQLCAVSQYPHLDVSLFFLHAEARSRFLMVAFPNSGNRKMGGVMTWRRRLKVGSLDSL